MNFEIVISGFLVPDVEYLETSVSIIHLSEKNSTCFEEFFYCFFMPGNRLSSNFFKNAETVTC